MFELFTARSGQPTARIGGRALHSPYDPVQEARRFVEQSFDEAPATVVVLGEGLGYTAACVRERFPDARLLLVYYSIEVHAASRTGGAPAWHPGLDLGLLDFLRGCLGELDMEGLRVIEWAPSAQIFPQASRAANQAVHQAAQELNGSFLTTVGAGRLWVRNSLANFLSLDTVLVGAPCGPSRPVLVAASGPSLEEAAPIIAGRRDDFDLWALPSACTALHAAGLEPDLVVLTDPGFYGMQHLRFAGARCPVAMPLSAARGSWAVPGARPGERGLPVYLLSQPGLFETPLLERLGIDAPVVVPHGTVAATAVDLALAFTAGPVIVAGLDMCARDLAVHARPAEFDRLLHLAAGRLSPHEGLLYARAAAQQLRKAPGEEEARTSAQLRTYAGWFSGPTAGPTGRVYRLLPSPVSLDALQAVDAGSLGALLGDRATGSRGPALRLCSTLPDAAERRSAAARLLDGWKVELAAAGTAIAGPQGVTGLAGHPAALQLAWHIEPQMLVETRRAERRGEHALAETRATQMITGCLSFLERLATKALHAS
jgi:hypothetical protein